MNRKKPGKVGENKSEVVRALPIAVRDEACAVAFLEDLRWGGKPKCPRCQCENVYVMADSKTGVRNKDYRWRCRECPKPGYFTVRTGTVMEEGKVPLRHWCWAFWQLCSSKKGVSAKQIQRQTGLGYKSALFLLHRVRFALADMSGVTLTGVVECDETYVGGKPRYRGTVESPINPTLGQFTVGHVDLTTSIRTALRGTVETLSQKQGVYFTLREASSGRDIRCYPGREFKQRIGETWVNDGWVIVEGTYNRFTTQPTMTDITEIFVIAPAKPGDWKHAAGCRRGRSNPIREGRRECLGPHQRRRQQALSLKPSAPTVPTGKTRCGTR